MNLIKKVAISSSLSIALFITPITGEIQQYNVSPIVHAFSQSVLHVNFDKNVNDQSHNQIQTKVFGNPTYQAGRVGSSMRFKEKGQYIELQNNDGLNFGEHTDFTVSFWIKSDKISGDPAIISNKNWTSGSNTGWIIAVNGSGNIVWNYKTSDSGRLDTTIPGVIDSKWHHIAISHDRDGLAKFYKDGDLINTVDISKQKGILDSSLTTKIAQDGTGKYGSTLTAQLDEMEIFHDALTDADVKALYENVPPLPPVAVDSITLDQTDIQLKTNGQMPIKAKISPADATDSSITWSSTDESIAKIEMIKDEPFIQAMTPGEAIITAKTVDGGQEAKIAVKVTNSYDVNGDGLINKDDLKFVLQNLNISKDNKYWDRAKVADLNSDSIVDRTDLKLMEEKIAPYMHDFDYERVVFIGIDGAGIGVKDERAKANKIKQIMREGAFTYDAQAMTPTISGPNWGSMFHAVDPAKHGLTNDNLGQAYPENNPYPSYMKLLKMERPQLKQASFATWGPINQGIIEVSAGAYKANGSNDTITTNHTIDYIKSNGKDSRHIFVHFDEVDGAGHNYGYGSTQWYNALAKADERVGQIIQALEDEDLMDSTLLIITTDHGGIGKGHGGNTDIEKTIFWTAKGGSIEPGTELSNIRNMDTAAVIARALRLDIPEHWDAKIPEQLFTR